MSPEAHPKRNTIRTWKVHKYRTARQKVRGKIREYNRITRLEVYRYFKDEHVQKFVDFLREEFEVLSPEGQPLSGQARFVMGLDGKTTTSYALFQQQACLHFLQY